MRRSHEGIMLSALFTDVFRRTHSRANFARVAHTFSLLLLVSAVGCIQPKEPSNQSHAAGSGASGPVAANIQHLRANPSPALTDPAKPARTQTGSGQTSFDIGRLRLETRALAAQAGYNATPARGQGGALNGTDLGWTFAHRDKLWVMFGDSWWLDPLNLASLPDDALGQISLVDFPDGPSVDAFVDQHPAARGRPAWHAAGPTMPVVMRERQQAFAPIVAERDGKPIPSGIAFVPMTGFSNGRDDASEGVFAIFFSYEHVPCARGACSDGFQCDEELGTETIEWLNPPCLVGSRLTCRRGPGVCQDRSTSIYDSSSEMGRAQAAVVRHDIGVTTSKDPIHFKTQAWDTQRFFNVTARTVSDFDPHRVNGEGNDYRPALGNNLERAGVFIWGRPQFGGIGDEGRDAQLYLLWSPMPEPDETQRFTWQPQYWSGLGAEGQPFFSPHQLDAKPLDLDAYTEGDQPFETRDYVGQMSISWLPSLQRWVQLYGGDAPPMFANAIFRTDLDKAKRNPEGSLYIRFAEHPWGPWTAPQQLIAAGNSDPRAKPEAQYAPGGLLAHNNCRTQNCAHYDPVYKVDPSNNNGVLYAPSIIDPWTTTNEGSTDLYWFLSTWNPYQVVLMKTSLSLEEVHSATDL